MECSCTISNWDYDSEDHCYEDLIFKEDYQAPRERECNECHEFMQPNEPHFCRTTIYFDENENFESLDRYRHCNECDEIITIFFDGYFMGMAWEDLRRSILDEEIVATESCLSKLSPKNLAKVCEIVEEMWENNYDEDENDY